MTEAAAALPVATEAGRAWTCKACGAVIGHVVRRGGVRRLVLLPASSGGAFTPDALKALIPQDRGRTHWLECSGPGHEWCAVARWAANWGLARALAHEGHEITGAATLACPSCGERRDWHSGQDGIDELLRRRSPAGFPPP